MQLLHRQHSKEVTVMEKYYQKPEAELICIGMSEAITAGDDTELGVGSNPFLAAVLEDEANEN